MSNALQGMIAGLVATLVLSGLMVLNSATDLMPQIHIIRWLTALGTLSVPAAWMDHFIVAVIIWGLLFAVYDGAASRPTPWLKGIIFGVFAWLMMMVTFMPLAGAGFFGSKVDISTHIGLLVLNLIFGAVLWRDLRSSWGRGSSPTRREPCEGDGSCNGSRKVAPEQSRLQL
jgi:uncharacterized protein DUF6789